MKYLIKLWCGAAVAAICLSVALIPHKLPAQSMLLLTAGSGGGGGSTLQTDNWMRANQNPLAGNWTQATGSGGTAELLSNQVTGADNAFAARIYYWNANSFTSNQYAQIVWNASIGFGFGGPAINVQTGASTLTGYVCEFQGPAILRYDSGAPTTIASPTGTFATGDILKCGNHAGVITMYKNGSALPGTATDSTYTNGSPGIYIFDGTTGGFALGTWQADDN